MSGWCVMWVDCLTCPLEVTDNHFVTQVTRVEAPFVFLPRVRYSDWWNCRLLTLIGWNKEFLAWSRVNEMLSGIKITPFSTHLWTVSKIEFAHCSYTVLHSSYEMLGEQLTVVHWGKEGVILDTALVLSIVRHGAGDEKERDIKGNVKQN